MPESFLATDAILVLLVNIAAGLEVHPARIRRRIEMELPFMATEKLLVRAVRAGGDRQAVHEVIRRHSIAAAAAMKEGAERNDLLDRLAADGTLGLAREEIFAVVAEPGAFTGRAAQQVDEFLREVVEPLLGSAAATPAVREMVRV